MSFVFSLAKLRWKQSLGDSFGWDIEHCTSVQKYKKTGSDSGLSTTYELDVARKITKPAQTAGFAIRSSSDISFWFV
jgi:hypothetical protein